MREDRATQTSLFLRVFFAAFAIFAVGFLRLWLYRTSVTLPSVLPAFSSK